MKNLLLIFTIVLLGSCTIKKSSNFTSGIITTVAGNGIAGYNGDNGAATAANIDTPHSVAVDGSGNLYVFDCNNLIRKVTSSGTISTIAGTGLLGCYNGNGGAATAADLSGPFGIAVDGSGNIYIVEGGNFCFCINKVTPSGTISTIAGGDTIGYSGDDGAATAAGLWYPFGVAVDGIGNVYIADGGNNRIRKVNPLGIISTIAGSGTRGYSGDGGPATAAALYTPQGVAVDGSGNVYIADAFNNRIRKVTPSGRISTIAGNGILGYSGDGGAAISAEFETPSSVAVDGRGNVYIADVGNNRIRIVTPSGIISTIAGTGTLGYSGDGRAAISAKLYFPYSVAVDGSGNVYIADWGNNRIRKVSH